MSEGTSIYCGEVCNHTGPHRYPPPVTSYTWLGTGIVFTHCPHGLDLRVHPRCYLCKPLESGTVVGCTCPGFWHGVIPPPCPIHNPPTFGDNDTIVTDHT